MARFAKCSASGGPFFAVYQFFRGAGGLGLRPGIARGGSSPGSASAAHETETIKITQKAYIKTRTFIRLFVSPFLYYNIPGAG